MNSLMLGLLAESPVHPGAGRGMGVVDLPVAREASTDYPVLVGSGLKGALRDKAEWMVESKASDLDVTEVFGRRDQAGALLVSDGRLLLLPVRSLTSSYRWITCPHLIERYQRDRARIGVAAEATMPQVERGTVVSSGSGMLFLEERQFKIVNGPEIQLSQSIEPLVRHDSTRKRLASQISVLHDDDFAWFVRYGLSVQARNVLEDGTKKSKNLWYEETLPTDTIMYSVVMGRRDAAIDDVMELFPESEPYLQVGGNETVGQGWFAVKALRRSDRDGREA